MLVKLILLLAIEGLLIGVVLPLLYTMMVDLWGGFWGTIMFVGSFILVGLFHLSDWLDKRME